MRRHVRAAAAALRVGRHVRAAARALTRGRGGHAAPSPAGRGFARARGRHVARAALSGRRCSASLARARRTGLIAGDAKRRHGLLIDLTGRLEALLPLERDQSLAGARPEHSVRVAHVKALLVKRDLQLPDLLRAQVHGSPAGAGVASILPRIHRGGGTRGHDGHDVMATIDDDDVVATDEVHVFAPLGPDCDQLLGDGDEEHALRHKRADGQREVDAVYARHVAAREHRLADARALALVQRDRRIASSARLPCLLLRRRAGSGLTLLLVGRAGCGLSLLRAQLPLLRLLAITSLRALLRLLRLLAVASLRTLLRLLALLCLWGLALLALLRLGSGLTSLSGSSLAIAFAVSRGLLLLCVLSCGLLALSLAFVALRLALGGGS